MTTPTQTAQPTSVPQQIQDHDAAALALELAAAVAASAVLKSQVDAIVRGSLLSWTRLFGPKLKTVQAGPRYVQFMRQLSTDLKAVKVDPGPVLVEYAARARDLGVRQAFAEAEREPEPLRPEADRDAHRQAKQAAESATKAARVKVQASARLARQQAATKTGSGAFSGVLEVVAPAQQAVNDVEAAAKTVTNDSLNQGIADVAAKTGGQLLWIAERTACLTCNALSGHISDSDGHFDQTLTFGKTAYPHKAENEAGDWVEAPLEHPPRHRNCRCRVTPWHGMDVSDPVGLPVALRREAERSVLNGYALPSESEGVRRTAADRLLARIGDTKGSLSPSGWAVPQSVKDKARRALAKGTFKTGPVPTGRK
jgi:hypothetical protein